MGTLAGHPGLIFLVPSWLVGWPCPAPQGNGPEGNLDPHADSGCLQSVDGAPVCIGGWCDFLGHIWWPQKASPTSPAQLILFGEHGNQSSRKDVWWTPHKAAPELGKRQGRGPSTLKRLPVWELPGWGPRPCSHRLRPPVHVSVDTQSCRPSGNRSTSWEDGQGIGRQQLPLTRP